MIRLKQLCKEKNFNYVFPDEIKTDSNCNPYVVPENPNPPKGEIVPAAPNPFDPSKSQYAFGEPGNICLNPFSANPNENQNYANNNNQQPNNNDGGTNQEGNNKPV